MCSIGSRHTLSWARGYACTAGQHSTSSFSTSPEAEHLARFAKADFAPELLFADDPDTLAAARDDPAVAWKLQNLAKTVRP
ncbi:MAG: hypothetical protein R2722_05020 [Tessaracoccus sp.]